MTAERGPTGNGFGHIPDLSSSVNVIGESISSSDPNDQSRPEFGDLDLIKELKKSEPNDVGGVGFDPIRTLQIRRRQFRINGF